MLLLIVIVIVVVAASAVAIVVEIVVEIAVVVIVVPFALHCFDAIDGQPLISDMLPRFEIIIFLGFILFSMPKMTDLYCGLLSSNLHQNH